MKCMAPMMIKNPDFSNQGSSKVTAGIEDRMIPVRCGRCEGCLKTSIGNWAFRLQVEAKRSLYVHFVTLTYDPEFVPLTKSIIPTLDKRDVQLFFKRLRKRQGKGIKYFIVGEYGTRSYRPHYHAIIYNCSDVKDYTKAWSVGDKVIGNVHIGDSIDNGAIPYTLKYMYKKGMVPMFEDDDRLPEFRMMSKRLGDNYLSPAMLRWHLEDFPNRQYAVLSNGIKISLPRYIREKIIELGNVDRKTLLKDEESVFMTSTDGDYRSLRSRVENLKVQQLKFEKKRGQDGRKKI